MNRTITLTVNGVSRQVQAEPRALLAYVLRDDLHLTGTHVGCDTSQCGACTVIIDGLAVKSCTVLAVQAEGSEVMTIEGLAKDGELHPIQEGFWEEHGLQCGFCTPGILLTLVAFLRDNPNPDEEAVRLALSGNLCRCTGYQHIVDAVLLAAQRARS